MSDPAADLRSDAEQTRRSAARTLATRHRGALLAYTRQLCRDDRTAQGLADEVFADTFAAARSGTGPTHAWRPHLLTAARRTAAHWADDHRAAVLAPAFLTWLHALPAPDSTAPRTRAAVLAEDNSPTLQAFRRLPEDIQAELWRCLEKPPGPAGHPHAVAVPPVRLVHRFHDAYLQLYALHTPRRDCRQLVARLGDAVRHGHGEDRALEHHLTHCPDCAHARVELAAIHTWQRPALLTALLLWTGHPRPTDQQAPPVHVPRAARAKAQPARADRTLALGLVVLGLAVLTVAAAARPKPPPAHSPSILPVRPTGPAPPTPVAAASTPATGPRPPTTSAPFRPSPTSRPSGLRLVNLRTGLCVTPGDSDSVRLETCTGADSQ
ncbi:hypothetical protein [Kitasatospora sp. NPDC088346]|uniref:hypothetical protein n=1 Tax=Kitasatospora sp. NPDC088346 TaxID=3364073 RepID=UPI00380AC103